jgi:hypothetical protein
MRKQIVCVLVLLQFVFACNTKPRTIAHKQFYYWKQSYTINADYQATLDACATQKIFIKCFDVDAQCKPVAKLHWQTAASKQYQYIPTVFIHNANFKQADTALASKVLALVNQIMGAQQIAYTQLQIDCDWTASTKQNYFAFLQQLKKISNKNISVTLRLYPYKYRTACGIPPADSVVLMCYDMGDFKNPNCRNSILDNNILSTYLINKPYPLPLSIALPAFSWQLLYRQGQFVGITKKLALQNTQLFTPHQNNYVVNKNYYDTNVHAYLQAGDNIRLEKPDAETLRSTIQLLQQRIQHPVADYIIFTLDSNLLQHYEIDKL